MAGMRSGDNLDKWRNYFRACNSDIFDILENGIKVAALDFPQEFKSKRDRIAEILHSSNSPKSVELRVEAAEKKVKEVKSESFCGGNKDREVESGSDDRKAEASVNKVENSIWYKDAEALTAEIEEEAQTFNEVLQIKKILENNENEAGSLVLDSLERLVSMPLTLEIMQATEIGKPVNALRKHASTDHIRKIAGTLVNLWKGMLDDWMRAVKDLTGGIEGGAPDSVNPSVVDDEEAGLPSPPLDDLSCLIDYDTSIGFYNMAWTMRNYLSRSKKQYQNDSSYPSWDLGDLQNQAGSLVSDSLKRLVSMPLTMKIMQATEIGKAVNGLRKHASTDI
ncbi:hypothetical protein POM88_041537 [Heracleum sosnowskyi]|uniref:TFIIS N-terminal domain-containing protein n=1 Tax=Heracleum sosnowskyi TaxID=360622 RepID=A0AAD8HF59_9APIA|nr:hypothetical protein POM88_041537 [Heracleum sosnowskyi]